MMLVMLVSDMYWPRVCRAIGRQDMEKDPRFASFAARYQNREDLVALLDELFAQRTLEDWARLLDAEGCIWAPAQTMAEVVADPQCQARGAFAKIQHPQVGEMPVVDTPVKFSGSQAGARGPAPELGQHTEEVLLEAGYNWDEIVHLRDAAVI